MSLERDNFRAGLFVLSGLVFCLVALFLLTDLEAMFRKDQLVRVRYSLRDGLDGLRVGAAVTLGDNAVGTVTAIDHETVDTGPHSRITGLIVTMRLPESIQLYENAIVELEAPPFGAGTRLNISHVGDGDPYDPVGILDGSLPPSRFVAQFVREMGIRDEQREQLRTMIADLQGLITHLREDVPRITDKTQAAIDRATVTLENVDSLVQENRPDIRKAVENVRALVTDVKERSAAWMERVDSITTAVNETGSLVRDLVKENGPRVSETIRDVQKIASDFRTKRMQQVESMLTSAGQAIEQFRDTAGEIRGFVTTQRPVLERAMANAQLASDQLKLATIEIRRSPWRLLYVPKDEELNTDNLYDAARAFALAAGTLDAASASLRATIEKNPNDRATITRQVDILEKLFERFEEAEAEFWKALKAGK